MSDNQKINTGKGKNNDGMDVPLLVPEDEYEPGEIYPHLPGHKFTVREFEVLEEFAKDLDLVRACAAAGYKQPKVKAAAMQKEDRFKAEFKEIYDIYRANVRMTAQRFSHRFMEQLEQFQQDYNDLDTKDRAKMANPIAKMIDMGMKATGHYDGRGDANDKQIVINIDLGGDKEAKVKAPKKNQLDVEVE